MAARVSENWSGFSWVRGVRAAREHFVTGAKTPLEAWSAVPEVGVSPPQDIDNTFPWDNSLRCQAPVLTQTGPQSYKINSTYGVPPNGTWESRGNAVSNLPQISWTPGTISVPVDRDVTGCPYVNANGDVLSGENRTIHIDTFRIVRPEPSYRYSFLKTFRGCVNAKALTSGGVTFEALDLKITNISPAQEYLPDAKSILIAYDIEVREEYIVKKQGGEQVKVSDPHQTYRIHKGRHAWAKWNDGTVTKGELAYKDQQPLSDEVPLNRKGIPFDTKLLVAKIPPTGSVEYATPVESPKPIQGLQWADDRAVPSVMEVQKFIDSLPKDFSPLKL